MTVPRFFSLSFILALIIAISLFLYFYIKPDAGPPMKDRVYTLDGIVSLFPTSVNDITSAMHVHMDEMRTQLQEIIKIQDGERTFANTAQALDYMGELSNLSIFFKTVYTLEMLSPQEDMRNAAHEAVVEIQRFFVEEISNNKKLYQAFKAYAQGNAQNETLTEPQRYFVQETLQDFKRAGLGLPDDQLAHVVALKKELAELTSEFDKNIALDASTITVDRDGLFGLDDEYILTLKTTDDGLYVLGVDYPTFFRVMENCAVEDTRKRLSRAFNNRAYPANDDLLKRIIAKRDELARALGFGSYAQLDIDDQMVKKPRRAMQFLYNLLDKAEEKENKELDRLLQELPDSVTLTDDGKIKSWDMAFLKSEYKKKHLAVDEQKLSEYFPMEHTVKALLDIYQQFFALEFKEVPVSGLWHKDVKAVQVYRKNSDVLLGTLFLDLHPRSGKFSHACHLTLVSAVRDVEGKDVPDVSVVMANFPKSTENKPSLLKRNDVKTFFHEFGHAMHAVLGATDIASFSGTNVKRDFVEMPSQMLEEWLWDKDIIRSVSSHYQTHEPIPDELLDAIIELKQFDSGMFVRRQAGLALLALAYYASEAHKEPYDILVSLSKRLSPRTLFDVENHFYASFGHLTGYGAKYYGYLWSKVFALDLFDTIKKEGLLNPVIGRRYIETVIGQGGSKDPRELLVDFLGREPRMDAFIKDLGL